MTDLVSVSIPAYNEEDVISAAIDSILSQTHEDLELILIDDGSTDRTLEVMRSYEDDSRVRVLEESGLGYCGARKLGIEEAHPEADWIGFCGADDRWFEEKLEVQLDFAGPADVVHSNVYHTEYGEYTELRWNDNPISGNDVIEQLFMRNLVCIQSAIVRPEAVPDFGFCDQMDVSCDHDFWLAIASDGATFRYIDKPLVEKSYHDDNLSSDYEAAFHDRLNVASRAYIDNPHLPLKRKVSNIYETYAINLIREGRVNDAREALTSSLAYKLTNWEAWVLLWLSLYPPLVRRFTKEGS